MAEIHDILYNYWGYQSFREPQEEIINSILDKKDTMVLMPTGGGKSICYQVPGLLLEGMTLVVTPLVALMKDQVYQLKDRNIIAYSIHSGMTKREIDLVLDNCIYGDVKFLYVSPERLQTELFQTRLERMNINLIAVDEAHCITQWGYDFRPSYLDIKRVREIKPDVPVLALTASATQKAVDDIQKQLQFKESNIIRKSFYRDNLNYYVYHEEDKRGKIIKMLQRNLGGSAIVYTRNRRATRELCEILIQNGIEATYYHAGLKAKVKDERQEQWLQGQIRVMVCTNAFGMGIDKPDVRLVIHYQMPDNLEAYYQEAGRAGRDGNRSHCVLLYNNRDISGLHKSMAIRFPELSKVKQAYQVLMNYYQAGIGNNFELGKDFSIEKICKKYDLNVNQTYYAMKSLESQGFITFSDAIYSPSKLQFLVDNGGIYAFQIANRKFENVLNTLLRSYGGLFDDFVVINESLIAKRAEMSEDEVIEQLERLSKMNILLYQKSSDRPKIWFMKGRTTADALQITDDSIRHRKDLLGEKLERMIDFVERKDVCRNRLILNYFDEQTDKDCGHCDVCINRKSMAKPKDRILAVLAKQALNAEAVVEILSNEFTDQTIVQEIRLLIDQNIIQRNDQGELCLRK